MTGQKAPGKSTSKANNAKRPRCDDEQGAASSSSSSEPSTKRRRTSHDNNHDGDSLMEDALPDDQNQDESSSSSDSSGFSTEESLSDIEVDVDDLESIHEFDMEDLGEFEAFGDHYGPITGEYDYSEAEDEDEEVTEPPSSPMSDFGQFWGRQDPPRRGSQSCTNCHGGKELLRLVMADGVESDSDDEF
ncbi:hypothetical protein QQX98_008909 [Neonectria punicea]|uniref:Uncharacterized protein n=1 Tax=Neonectria punicea TaxID=979145 RepID=A0ABR1GTW0_9HYPO